MKIRSIRSMVESLLQEAEIKINGSNPWDIQVHDTAFYSRVLRSGSLGFGESYMEGLWDTERVDLLIERLLLADLGNKVTPFVRQLSALKSRWVNLQTRQRALEVAKVHYNLSNEFYQSMLDQHMAYSCGFWKEAETLQQAQDQKLKMICEKVGIKPGMRVLDIGCGWGSFCKYAAEHYAVDVVGINISDAQIELARQRCQGLPVDIRQQDYRDVDESFDAIVSIGMFEHVGQINYRQYMQVARRCLKPEGLFLLHTIGKLDSRAPIDPWIEHYIFPNADLPSIAQIAEACEAQFVVEDLHNIGADYDRTLMSWFDNFKQNWPRFRDQFGDRFYRMWSYYLLGCAGASRARSMQVWQWVLSPGGVAGGYHRPC